MTLRKRVLLITGLTLCGLLALLFFESHIVLLGSFRNLEEQCVREDVQRALSALADELTTMDRTARDWAAWDATYEFVHGDRDEYVAENLMDSTLVDLHLNLMLFLDEYGRMVFGKAVDFESGRQISLPEGLQEHIAEGALLLDHPHTRSSISGILSLPEGPLLVVSRPIVTSYDRGPIRGTLLMGRFLDVSEVDRIAQTVHLSLAVHSWDEPDMSADFQSARSQLSEQDAIFVHALDSDSIAGYARISDIYGNPVTLLRISMPRDIYQQGRMAMRYFVLLLLAGCLACGVVVFLAFDRKLLSGLNHIRESVRTVRPGDELESPDLAEDELSDLVNGVDSIVTALRARNRELTLLHEATVIITSTLSLDEVLRTVAKQMTQALGCSGCAISRWNREEDRIETWVDYNPAWPEEIDPLGTIYPLCDYPTTRAALESSELLVHRDDPDIDGAERDWMNAQGVYTVLKLPLVAGDRVWGLVELIEDAQRREYTPEELRLAQNLVAQAGGAIENARLYETARQVDRLSILNELDEALVATLDLERITKVTLECVGRALGLAEGMLFSAPPTIGLHRVDAYGMEAEKRTVRISERELNMLSPLLHHLHSHREAFLIAERKLPPALRHGATDADPRYQGLAVPIWDERSLVAVLVLGGWPVERPFGSEDRALIQAIANRAGQAIKNARFYQASQDRAARLAALNLIGAAAVSSLEVDVVLRQVLEMTCHVLGAEAGSVLLRESSRGGLFFAVTVGSDMEHLRGHHLPAGSGIVNWVADQGRAVRVNDVFQDPRWCAEIDELTGSTTRSVLCAPLKQREKIAGVIEVANKRTGGFSEDDLILLESISYIAASALENARLYMKTRAHRDELKMLNEIGLVLTSTLDMATVVRAALSQVYRLFHAERISLFRCDPQSGAFLPLQSLVRGSPSQETPQFDRVVERVMVGREPLLVEDALAAPDFSLPCDDALRALMAVPLLNQDRLVGAMVLTSSEPGMYTKSDVNTLQAIKMLLREREEAQTRLIRSEKMAALGRLTVSLAHEINNPLQALRSGLGLLLTRDFDEQKRQQYLEVARNEVERLIAVVERVLGFYHPSGERMCSVSVNDILEETLLLLEKELEQGGVVVRRHLAPDLPPLRVVPDQLKQVFLNIILNALQAMPQGGELTIETERDRNEPQICIAFTDTAGGIPADRISRLFEPFYTTRPDGSGLGLTISYGIVERHGGRIEVRSELGLGSTFVVALPVTQESDEVGGEERFGEADGG